MLLMIGNVWRIVVANNIVSFTIVAQTLEFLQNIIIYLFVV